MNGRYLDTRPNDDDDDSDDDGDAGGQRKRATPYGPITRESRPFRWELVS